MLASYLLPAFFHVCFFLTRRRRDISPSKQHTRDCASTCRDDEALGKTRSSSRPRQQRDDVTNCLCTRSLLQLQLI